MTVVLSILLIESLILTFLLLGRRRLLLGWSKSRALMAPQPIAATTSLPVKAMSPSEAAHWAFINEWHSEGQDDDRLPMGVVTNSGGTASARRALSRRSRQRNYKEWSRQRHD